MPNPYLTHITAPTPQNQPIPGREHEMVKNAAGGYGWQVDKWQQLNRFLVIGSEGGTYYIGERELTLANTAALQACLKEDSARVVNLIADIANTNRAPKPDALIFALALACLPKYADEQTRFLALGALSIVVRTGTQLFQFCEIVDELGGWSRMRRRGVANWYTSKQPRDLAYQLIKYRQRNGWTHRDVLRLTHPKITTPATLDLVRWAVKGEWREDAEPQLSQQIYAFEIVQKPDATLQDVVRLVTEQRLPREAIPTQWLNEPDVWAALLADMPLGALLRNLGKLSAIGLLKPMARTVSVVAEKLTNAAALKKARIHPINILYAMRVYGQGHGEKGSLKWTAVPQVMDALNDAFYLAYESVEPTGLRVLSCPDISGSMNTPVNGLAPLLCSESAGALTMVDVNREPNQMTLAWGRQAHELTIGKRSRLDEVMRQLNQFSEGTDASVPLRWALETRTPVDVFVVYTDTESWAGNMHLYWALERYRQETGIPAKVVMVAMAANTTTLVPPDDAGCLDIVGFDASAPSMIAEFARGNI